MRSLPPCPFSLWTSAWVTDSEGWLCIKEISGEAHSPALQAPSLGTHVYTVLIGGLVMAVASLWTLRG